MHQPDHAILDEMKSALGWWREAGVDCDYADDATAWLAEAPPANNTDHQAAGSNTAVGEEAGTAGPSSTLVEQVDLLGDSPPQSLAEFREFWLTAPGLDAIGPRGRVPPRGPANARLMVLVLDPEQRDSDTLLSGPQGQLLKAMLSAKGVPEAEVYFASALPRHTPMADADAAARAGLADVLALHIKLAAPKRVIAFGRNILPLLMHGVTNDETNLREINQNPSPQEPLVSEGLDSLMAMPRLKARFWRRWIEWSR